MKQNRTTLALTTFVCLLPVIVAVILYPQMPDQVVTHWDASGVPNGWQSKFVGTIVFPGILVLVNLALPFLMKADPKYDNMDGKLRAIVYWIIPLVSVLCSSSTLGSALGMEMNVTRNCLAAVGLLFLIIGNYLPKTKQSYTMGIKLPWTLNSEENWNRTHRIGGFIWVIGGLVILIGAFLPKAHITFTVAAILMILVPCVYSYRLYKKGI